MVLPTNTPAEFIHNNSIVSNTTDIVNSSFVFGSTSMDNVPGTSDNAKFFFNKDKSAFRAGYVSNDNWNINSLGLYSFAAGSDTTASGKSSTAMGAFTIAQSYSEVVLGRYNDTATSVNSSYF